MPIWDTAKGDVPWNNMPNSAAAFFGSGSGTMRTDGTLYTTITAAGANPSSTGADIVFAAYTLPASSFDLAYRGIFFAGFGSLASNTNTKTLKIIAGCTSATVGSAVSGGTTIASAAFTTAAAAGGWSIGAGIYKYGAAGSNTQLAIHQAAQSNSVVGTLTAPQALTLTESGSIIFALTGNAATTATDITYYAFTVEAYN
jgi:hypothetical protein